jgi:hypothetical protein
VPEPDRPEQTAANVCCDEVTDDVRRPELENKGALHMAAHAYIFQTNLPKYLEKTFFCKFKHLRP